MQREHSLPISNREECAVCVIQFGTNRNSKANQFVAPNYRAFRQDLRG